MATQKFQESLAYNLQDTEDDQYLGKHSRIESLHIMAHLRRSFDSGVSVRIQTSDSGFVQMLSFAAKGNFTFKDFPTNTEASRCFSSDLDVSGCVWYNLL